MSIYAVDFDKTLTIGSYEFPDTGRPNIGLFHFLIEKQRNGHSIILWTCRAGHDLDVAVAYCRNMGLTFDAVNDNLPKMVEAYHGNNSRKVFADYYIDDRAVSSYEDLLPKSAMKPKEVQTRKARVIRR